MNGFLWLSGRRVGYNDMSLFDKKRDAFQMSGSEGKVCMLGVRRVYHRSLEGSVVK